MTVGVYQYPVGQMHAGFKLVIFFSVLLFVCGIRSANAEEAQQVSVSPTPVPINLPSPIPFDAMTPVGLETATPTRTPTPIGPALLEARTEANVRAEPDPAAELLGTIRAGDLYPVIGRYYRWLQLQYDRSPTGRAWVFDELVNIVGDASVIRDLTVDAAPTEDAIAQEQTATFEAITQTPGGILTATANARVITIPGLPGIGGDLNAGTESTAEAGSVESPALLPTFTFPPNLIAATPVPELAASPTATPESAALSIPDQLPPIVPILLLGAMGVLGLAVSAFRR